MRITHEADYAIRVCCVLGNEGAKLSAKDISDRSGVTLRFALKILRKLIQEEIVRSYKGVTGGYELIIDPKALSFGQIIEIIDGPISINHCLSNEFSCTRVEQKCDCNFHRVFGVINTRLRDDLYALTLDQFIDQC